MISTAKCISLVTGSSSCLPRFHSLRAFLLCFTAFFCRAHGIHVHLRTLSLHPSTLWDGGSVPVQQLSKLLMPTRNPASPTTAFYSCMPPPALCLATRPLPNGRCRAGCATCLASNPSVVGYSMALPVETDRTTNTIGGCGLIEAQAPQGTIWPALVRDKSRVSLQSILNGAK